MFSSSTALFFPSPVLPHRNMSKLWGILVALSASLWQLTWSPISRQLLAVEYDVGRPTPDKIPCMCWGHVLALTAVVTGVRYHYSDFLQVFPEYSMSCEHLRHPEGQWKPSTVFPSLPVWQDLTKAWWTFGEWIGAPPLLHLSYSFPPNVVGRDRRWGRVPAWA